MLALLGLAAVVGVLALITSRRMTALVALIVVPVAASIAGGFGLRTSSFIVEGIQQTAPVAAMFLFAILYFGVMTDAGMLDPIVDAILRAVGMHPTRIVLGSALLALLVHLDGSGAVTFLVTIPAMAPLYERLRMDKRVQACVASHAAGVNFLPWTGPVLRASTALHVTTTDLFRPLIPAQIVGLIFVASVAIMLGKREERRLALLSSQSPEPSVGSAGSRAIPPARELSAEQQSLRRPHLFWVNVVLTLIVMTVMVIGVVDPSVMFMLGTAIALVVNYRDSNAQRARVD